MDTSETYIKMSMAAWPDIKSGWAWSRGDWGVSHTDKDRVGIIGNIGPPWYLSDGAFSICISSLPHYTTNAFQANQVVGGLS